MSKTRDEEFTAFLQAKSEDNAEKRLAHFRKIKRKRLLLRLVDECPYGDVRAAVVRKLGQDQRELFLRLVLEDGNAQVRTEAIKKLDRRDIGKAVNSPFADMRLHLAKTMGWVQGLQRLLMDSDARVRTAAELALKTKRDLYYNPAPNNA